MITKNIAFQIRRCIGSRCKSAAEIDKFVSDIEVQGWNIQDSINFEIYGGINPVYKIMNEWG
jgi:hypothetical protein